VPRAVTQGEPLAWDAGAPGHAERTEVKRAALTDFTHRAVAVGRTLAAHIEGQKPFNVYRRAKSARAGIVAYGPVVDAEGVVWNGTRVLTHALPGKVDDADIDATHLARATVYVGAALAAGADHDAERAEVENELTREPILADLRGFAAAASLARVAR
jgi:hypothetical protein